MSLLQRFMLGCANLALVCYTIYMVLTLWDKFLIHPTVTSLVSSTYPVTEVPFPGVSICSVNKISKKRAQNLAIEIANLTNRDPELILEYVRFLGQLYDFDYDLTKVSQLLEFQNILDRLNLSVIDLTRKIAPSCETILNSCFWQNISFNCSKIFSLRLTDKGYCCVFNYVKKTSEIGDAIWKEAARTDSGVANGLSVSTNNYLSDYFYTTLSAPGIMVLIFNPVEFPDKISGGVTEVMCRTNTQNFIEIEPTTLISVDDLLYYSPDKRGCLFDHESVTDFQDLYSQSDCNVECRVESVISLCSCIPFMIPLSNKSNVCTLADVACLNKYKDKWACYFPKGFWGRHLRKEKQECMRCERVCYSPCNETVYSVSVNSFPIYKKSTDINNTTDIYIYYPQGVSKLYRQDVVYYWFEILSNFGGIFGIFVGWSFISMIQYALYSLRRIINKLVEMYHESEE